jgi:uncharacterized protein (DUF111 family)
MAKRNRRIINLTAEYDDCKRVALEKKIPLKKVMDEVKSEALSHLSNHLD